MGRLTNLGGWDSEIYDEIFPKRIYKLINGSPFDFTKDELEALIEALECALKKVPISDFYGVYHHDFGKILMGVRFGVPFIVEMGYEYDRSILNFIWMRWSSLKINFLMYIAN
jgi:hypothetical protein